VFAVVFMICFVAKVEKRVFFETLSRFLVMCEHSRICLCVRVSVRVCKLYACVCVFVCKFVLRVCEREKEREYVGVYECVCVCVLSICD